MHEAAWVIGCVPHCSKGGLKHEVPESTIFVLHLRAEEWDELCVCGGNCNWEKRIFLLDLAKKKRKKIQLFFFYYINFLYEQVEFMMLHLNSVYLCLFNRCNHVCWVWVIAVSKCADACVFLSNSTWILWFVSHHVWHFFCHRSEPSYKMYVEKKITIKIIYYSSCGLTCRRQK